MYYATRLAADVSYNATFLGCWAYVEISMGIIVICSLSLPKLYETKASKLKKVFLDIKKSVTSSTSRATLVPSTRLGATLSRQTTRSRGFQTQTSSEYDLSLNLTNYHHPCPDVPPLPTLDLNDEYLRSCQSKTDRKQHAAPV